jgi:hypothetical protein
MAKRIDDSNSVASLSHWEPERKRRPWVETLMGWGYKKKGGSSMPGTRPFLMLFSAGGSTPARQFVHFAVEY